MSQLQEKMNVYLANQLVNYVKLHNLHWNVKGGAFFTMHQKLEEMYDQAATVIDDVAERLLAISGTPVSNLKEALEIAKIVELSNGPKTMEETLHQLKVDNEWWVKDIKEIIKLADDEEDIVTADMFTGYLKYYEKLAWMLEAAGAK